MLKKPVKESRPVTIKKGTGNPTAQKPKEKKSAVTSTDILALESLLFSLQYLNLKQKVVVNTDLSELRALKEIEKEKQKLEAELDYLNNLGNIDYNLMKMVQDNMQKYTMLQNFVKLHSKMVSQTELEEFKQNLSELGIRNDWDPTLSDSNPSAENEAEYNRFKSSKVEIEEKLEKQEMQRKQKIATLVNLYLNKP
ncbi:hypothetical protein HDV06_004260 [Boothiomyces sp. JEL0866]|nr:hypothetical protein HDV06_004260 [Boothiomyces sp. JEL0866]